MTERRIDDVEDDIRAIVVFASRTEQRLDAIEEILADHTRRLDAIEGRLDVIEGRLDVIEHRLDSIEATQITQGKQLTQILDILQRKLGT